MEIRDIGLPRSPATAAVLAALLVLPAAGAGEAPPDHPEGAGLTLLDGREVPGEVVGLSRSGVDLEGGRSYSVESLHEVRLGGKAAPGGEAPASKPGILFATGEFLPGRIGSTAGRAIRIEPAAGGEGAGAGLDPIDVPLGGVRAIVLDPAAASEPIYRAAVEGKSPEKDLFLVRKGTGIIKAEGVLEALGDAAATVEHGGRSRRLRRDTIAAIVLARIAGSASGSARPVVLWLRGGGRIPAEGAELSSGPGGSILRADVLGVSWRVPAELVQRVTFGGDRIRYLSDLRPEKEEALGLFGKGFPYRPDLSVTGRPIRLGGREYRKGIGVHPRSVLSFGLDGRFGLFAARVGIDDASAGGAEAVITVRGDGQVLHREIVGAGRMPRDLLLPVAGVRTLEIEADFIPGDDGIGAHVDWAEARLLREGEIPTTLTGR